MKKLNTAVGWFNRIFLVVAVFCLVLTVVFSAIQAASRYIPNFKLLGMEELARMTFIWCSFLGMSLAVAEGSHACVDAISSKVPEKIKPYYNTVLMLLVLLFSVFLFKTSLDKIEGLVRRGQTTPLFSIPMQLLYLPLTLGAGGCIINCINNAIQGFSKGGKTDA